jgi:hypothetical protein
MAESTEEFWENAGRSEEDMSFEVDTQGEVTSKDAVPTGGGGKQVNREGRYHTALIAVKKEAPKTKDTIKEGECPFTSPFINLTFDIYAGGPAGKNTHDDQVGLKIYHKIYLWKWDAEHNKFVIRSGKELKFISQIAYGLSMITKEELDSQKFALNFANREGTQCVVEVRDEPYDVEETEGGKTTKVTKHSFKIPFGNVWRPDAEEVKDVKKDPDAMAIWLSGGGAADGGSPELF